jgi:hypothetical protein
MNKFVFNPVLIEDYKRICRLAREEDENFKPLSESNLEFYNDYTNTFWRDAFTIVLRYYLGKKEYERIMKEEFKTDENFQKQKKNMADG